MNLALRPFPTPARQMVKEWFLLSAAASNSNILSMPISPLQRELLKNTPIESLHWNKKVFRALEEARCRNLGDVFSITKEEWAERRLVGKKSITEMENRIQKFLKIKRMTRLRRPCDTTSIEQKIRTNQIPAALAEAFVMGGLTTNEIQVLELRYGISGHVTHSLGECAKMMERTRQRMLQLELAGMRRLSRHPDIRRAFQGGLQAMQGRLLRQIAEKNERLIPKKILMRELCKRISGPENLLVKVCYGDLRKWLNKNLTSTPGAWLLPKLNEN